jgi:hypothetical protein
MDPAARARAGRSRAPWLLPALALAALGFSGWFALWTPGQEAAGACAALRADEAATAARLAKDVEHLAIAIGPRSPKQAVALEAAAQYAEDRFRESGWRVARQPVGPGRKDVNVAAEPAGGAGAIALVIGAHYDTVPASPGADDDASGMAALFELARLFAGQDLPIRLVAFTNEEMPRGGTESRGSLVAARESRARRERLIGMIALDAIGYFTDEPGSQRHPPPLGAFFPDTGSFAAFVANVPSRAFLHQTIAAFRAASAVPAEGIAVPELLVPHVRRSDHASYWDAGYAALLVTDTADFRSPHYHRASDLPGTLDFPRLAQVTVGLASAARCLTSAGAPAEEGS